MMSYQTQSARESDDPACTDTLRPPVEDDTTTPAGVFVDPRTGEPSVTMTVTIPVRARNVLDIVSRVSGRSPEQETEVLAIEHAAALADMCDREWEARRLRYRCSKAARE